MLRLVLLAVAVALPLSCASSSGRTSSDVRLPIYGPDTPPACPFEEVGRIGELPQKHPTVYRDEIKRMGGDAVIYDDGPREYIVIRFSDQGCLPDDIKYASDGITDPFPKGATVFYHISPPGCPYEEVARLSYLKTQPRTTTADVVQENRQKYERHREEMARTYYESGADAILVGRENRDLPQDYFFITFTDPDCLR